MLLHELEVFNFKSLNNFGMPLKFHNINILIGENDSGKTSLLELIQIIIGEKEVTQKMFFDKNKEIKIKAKFINADKIFLEEAMILQTWPMTYYKYFENISRKIRPDDDDFDFVDQVKEFYFNDYCEDLKNYNFYSILKNFYSNIINNLAITIEKEIKFDEKPIVLGRAYFDFNDNLKKEANVLLSNVEFINFMNKYLLIFKNRIKEIFNEMTSSNGITESRFNFYEDHEFEYWPDIKNDRDESYFLDYIKQAYSSIIFTNDDKEVKLSKIANIISVFINKKNSEKCIWDCAGFLRQKDNIHNENFISNSQNYQDNFLIEDYNISEVNIINHALIGYKSTEFLRKLELPKLKVFSSEVINENVPYELFNDMYKIPSLKDYTYENIMGFIKNDLIELLNNDFLKIKSKEDRFFLDGMKRKILEYMELLNEQIDNINIKIDVNIDNLVLLNQFIEPIIEFNVQEKNKIIDITQKGQGFLRKLMIADFLMLVEDYDKLIEFDSPNIKNNKIILIEEPELHLHPEAQRKIMNVLKQKLEKSSNQVFVTTHSHFVIEDVGWENIYIFSKDKNLGITEIKNINQYINKTEIIKALQKSMGLKKTDLLFFKKLIILVEGKNDIAFIKGLCNRKDININSEDILFIEVMGQPNIEYYIGLGEFLKIRTLVILDNNKQNYFRRNRILENTYLNKKIEENIIKIQILDKIDLLNYLDINIVENYYKLPKNSISLNNSKDQLKNILYGMGKHIKEDDIEFLVIQMPKINEELKNKIIDIIKLYEPY